MNNFPPQNQHFFGSEPRFYSDRIFNVNNSANNNFSYNTLSYNNETFYPHYDPAIANIENYPQHPQSVPKDESYARARYQLSGQELLSNLEKEINEETRNSSSHEKPSSSSSSVIKIKQLDIKKSDTVNGEPKNRQRWFLKVREIKTASTQEEYEWTRKMQYIQRTRDNHRYRQPPMAPRFQNKTPPNKHPISVSFVVVEWIDKTFKQAMKHQVVKLNVAKDEQARKDSGYNSLLRYKLDFENNNNSCQSSSFIKLAEGDIFQIESLNFYIGKKTGFWFTDLSFDKSEGYANLNTGKVSYKHFSAYLGNIKSKFIAPSPSVSPDNSAELNDSSSTVKKMFNKSVEKVRNGSGQSSKSRNSVQSAPTSQLSKPEFQSSARSETSIKNQLKNEKSSSANFKNQVRVDRRRNQPYYKFDPARKLKNRYSNFKVPENLQKIEKLTTKPKKISEEDLPYFTELPKLPKIEKNYSIRKNRKLKDCCFCMHKIFINQFLNLANKCTLYFLDFNKYYDYFWPVNMEKVLQEFRHHVQEGIYHEHKFFGIITEVTEDFEKLRPQVNDEASYYTQDIKSFKVIPFIFETDENNNRIANKNDFWATNFLQLSYKDKFSCDMDEDDYILENAWSKNFTHFKKKFASEYPDVFIGTFVEFCYTGDGKIHPKSVVPMFNVLSNVEQFMEWFPRVNLRKVIYGLTYRQKKLTNFIKNRKAVKIPEIELEIRRDDDKYIVDKKPEKEGYMIDDELMWRGKEYLMQLMTGGENANWDHKVSAGEIEKFKIDRNVKNDSSKSKKSKNKSSSNNSSDNNNTFALRPLLNPALVLKRYQELINRAKDYQNDFKNIDQALNKIREDCRDVKGEKRTENMVTKVQEAVKLTNSGMRLLENEVDMLDSRVQKALEVCVPKGLADEVKE